MLLALAVLLIHPQIATAAALSAATPVIDGSSTSITSASLANTESLLPDPNAPAETSNQPASETGAALPDAPASMLAAVTSTSPAAYLKSGKPLTVSVAELREENRRKQMMWTGLSLATTSAATFDAISTRRAITRYGAVEMNPLLKPFAGNASLFAAIQVAPALLDIAGKRMMYSRHSWVRRVWWVPQSASFVSSIVCGAHNLNYR
ncbi:MAG TPA: hypothetical protein VH161_10790 [Candidatus Acidoferrales bacterium]|jgi:hypothetical protein|nr:hypothetical protein [Candidatus Acidoferrales bacterium]